MVTLTLSLETSPSASSLLCSSSWRQYIALLGNGASEIQRTWKQVQGYKHATRHLPCYFCECPCAELGFDSYLYLGVHSGIHFIPIYYFAFGYWLLHSSTHHIWVHISFGYWLFHSSTHRIWVHINFWFGYWLCILACIAFRCTYFIWLLTSTF